MANHQMLDNIRHKDLRIITTPHPDFGDEESYARLSLSELRYAQSEYPIFFRKNQETGAFELIAMFGFDVAENLFLSHSGWDAHYLPLSIQRQPFLIGFQQTQEQGIPIEKAVVHIDMDSPRVNSEKGEAIFLPQGGHSEYLQHISSVLQAINEGHKQLPDFFNTLINHELIETVDLKVTLRDNTNHQLKGLYTIHQENLSTLDGEALIELHNKHYLEAIYMIIASIENLSKLIERKNNRLSDTAKI